MGRSARNPSNQIKGLKKGPWTPQEDQRLIDHINKHGHGVWKSLPKKAGLDRCGKSCRLRWTNYLRPDIKRGDFSPEEEQAIINLHASHGNKWSMIASRLPGRTDNEIKNFWNTRLRKKLIRSGIDPNTHQLIPDFGFPSNVFVNPIENMAKIRLLENILHVLRSLSPYQVVPTEIPNLESNNHLMNFQPICDTFEMTPEVHHGKKSGTVNSTGSIDIEDHRLPGLVPASREVSSGDQLLGSESCYDGWDAAMMDDEPSDSFWRDILVESFLVSLR